MSHYSEVHRQTACASVCCCVRIGRFLCWLWAHWGWRPAETCSSQIKWYTYTGCPRRNGQNFGRVFLMLNYTDITQNTYIQSWTVWEIMAIEKCGLLGCPRTVRRAWRHSPVRMPGNQTPLANVAMRWPWRDYASVAACVKCLVTLRTTMTWVRVFL